MSGQSLDYTITNKAQLELHQGKIDAICQKNSGGGLRFFPQGQNPKIIIQIKLKQKAIVSFVQIKNNNSSKVIIELMNEKNIIHQTVSYYFKQEKQTTLIQAKESCKRRKQTIKIKVQLENLQKGGAVGIWYLLIRGQKCIQEPKNKIISKNFAEKEFFDAKVSPHYKPSILKARENKQTAIFSERKKNKENNLRGQSRQDSEEKQLKKVIELSKKEAERKNHSKERDNKTENKAKDLPPIDEWSNTFQSKAREYTRIDYDKCKDIFKYVNATWVEAQKNAETEKGVAQSQRLSNAIVVRVFNNKIVCIDVADRSKKAELLQLCIEMGARVKDSPEDNCLLIADRVDTEKVAKGRKLKGVKVLRQNFVIECNQCHAYLDEKEYYQKY